MRRTSTRLIAVGVATAIIALGVTMYLSGVERAFSAPTAVTMGTVLSHSGQPRRALDNEPGMLCWVSYRFTPAAGGPPREGWSMWREACALRSDASVPIQYVIANPDISRVPDGGLPISPLLLWFAAGVVIVIGFVRRGSETDA